MATGSAFPYSLSASSPDKNVAAAFLDYMVSEAAAQGVYAAGFVPVTPTDSLQTGGLEAEILASYEAVVAGAGVGPFPRRRHRRRAEGNELLGFAPARSD